MPHFYQKKDVQEIHYIKDARENKAAEIYLMTIIFLSTVSTFSCLCIQFAMTTSRIVKLHIESKVMDRKVEMDWNKVRKIS